MSYPIALLLFSPVLVFFVGIYILALAETRETDRKIDKYEQQRRKEGKR